MEIAETVFESMSYVLILTMKLNSDLLRAMMFGGEIWPINEALKKQLEAEMWIFSAVDEDFLDKEGNK